MNEWKKIIIVFSIISVLSCVSIFMIYQEKNDFEKQYYQLVDLESTENGSLRQLLNQDDLLTRLNAFNEDLRKSEQFTFIEFLPNVVEIIGEWDKPAELVNGYEYAWNLYDLSLSEGSEFEDIDYILTEKKLPLILGSEFKDYYSLGDEIPLVYFFEEWTGVVKGFLEEDEVIKQDWNEYLLNKTILVPSFREVSEELGIDLQKRLYYAQLEGYVLLEDKSDYSKASKEIKKLSQKYNLPYELLRGY